MIICKDLIKIFEDEERGIRIPALRGCDFVVDKGEIVTIVGPSGSGKTTLVNILAGLETISSGACNVAGYELEQMSQKALNKYRLLTIGLVDQYPERTLFLDATVDENMRFSTSLITAAPEEYRERNETIREKLGINHLADRKVRVLSGGEMIRTALACALAKNAQIILADEPTGQLDSENTEKVKELLREIASTFGTTILVVSHDPRFHEGVDRSCEIRDGRVTSMISIEEQELLSDMSSFPIKFRGQIDSSSNVRIPDLVLESLKLDREIDFQVAQNGNTTLVHPKGVEPKEVILEEIKVRRKTLQLKPLSKNHFKRKKKIIELKDVSKIYQGNGAEVIALANISLRIPKGELLFIIGPSGSGKTTLVKLLTGLEEITSGTILLNNEDFTKLSESEKADYRRTKMGLVSQQGNLHPFLTIDDNFYLKDIFSLKRLKESDIAEKNDVHLKKYQIDHRRTSYPLDVSGGELQRATLAIANYESPPIIILDEPTANFDSELAEQAMDEIYKTHQKLKTTTVIATHDINLIRDGFRTIELKDGKIHRDGLAFTE